MRLDEISSKRLESTEYARIQLGRPRTDDTNKFMEDYIELTSPHPFSDKTRVFGNAMLEIYPYFGNIHLSDIRTMAPKSGAASNAVKMLTGLSNKHFVKIELIAKPYSTEKRHITDINSLVNFYKKLGFVVDEEYDHGDPYDGYEGYEEVGMIYYPR
jgi:hypothetical protein